MIPLNLRILLVGISLPFHSLAAPNQNRANSYVHGENGKSRSPGGPASLLPARSSKTSDLNGFSTSAAQETYPTSTDGYDQGTSVGMAYGTGSSSIPKSGLYPLYNSTSQDGSLNWGTAQQTSAFPTGINQACSAGATSTQTVTTIMTDTQTVTTVVTSTQIITSTTTATITAYITATVTSTIDQASGGSGPTSGVAPISAGANGSTGANGASYPNIGNQPNTAEGSVAQSMPGANIPYSTGGQPIYSQRGTGNAFGTPFPTGNPGQSSAAVPYNSNGNLPTLLPVRPSYPINSGSSYALSGSVTSPRPYPMPGPSSATNIPNPVSSPAPTLNPPYPITPKPSPQPTSTGIINSLNPGSNTTLLATALTTTTPPPKLTPTCTSPSTTTNTAFFDGLNTTLPLPTPYLSLNFTTFEPAGSAPFEYILSPHSSPPYLHSIQLPHTPNPKTGAITLSFTLLSLLVSCSPQPANISCTVDLWGLKAPSLTSSGAASGGLARQSIQVPPGAGNWQATQAKGEGAGRSNAGGGWTGVGRPVGHGNEPWVGPPGGETGVGVPVNFTGAGWMDLQSVGFEAKVDGPWGETDGRTGVGVDGLAWEVVTCP